MTPSEYRYQIEKIYAESLHVKDWLVSESDFQQFVTMAKTAGSGSLVLDNWKIYLDGGGDPKDFFEWWMEYRPDKLELEDEQPEIIEKKKSPFDAVKKKVRIE